MIAADVEWRALALPTLILCSDEDEPFLQPSLWLERVLPNTGLALFVTAAGPADAAGASLF